MEWNFEKRISDSGPSKQAWILVYSSRIKFYSHPQNPGYVPCKLHEKQYKVHGFLCNLHTSRTCTYCHINFYSQLACMTGTKLNKSHIISTAQPQFVSILNYLIFDYFLESLKSSLCKLFFQGFKVLSLGEKMIKNSFTEKNEGRN